MRRSITLLVVLGLGSTAAPVRASPQDVAATHAAVVAGYRLARAGVATIKIAQSRIESYNRKLAAECPGVGAGTPENEASQPMSYEVAVALWSIAYGSARAPIETFAKALRPLRWSSARINRDAHTFVKNLIGLATIPMPDLCADVRSWVDSRFATVPPRVVELDRHVEPLEVPEAQWDLLAPYAAGADQGRIAYIKHAERKIAEAEFVLGQNDWYQVLDTLALPP
jgi:hypothetical protein